LHLKLQQKLPLKQHKKKFRPTFTPGAKFDYSNTNYLLLAVVVERVSKKSFGAFMHDEVFQPLGMNNSWVHERPDSAPKAGAKGPLNAAGYEQGKRGRFHESWGTPPWR